MSSANNTIDSVSAGPLAADKPARCNTCAHYYITHEVHFRYGCRALGFKSQQQPIRVVMEASAQQCLYFQPKK